MRQIKMADCTLSVAAENKTSLLFREKCTIASCADNYGASFIELPPVTNLKDDRIVAKTICESVKKAGVSIPVGFSLDELENAFKCVKYAKKPCLQVSLPMSTVCMEYTYHVKSDKMLLKIAELCSAAKQKECIVEFIAKDASRCETEYLIEACKTATNNGADFITLSDDAGLWIPDEVSSVVKQVKSAVGIPVYVKVSDALGLAPACAISAVTAGADGLKAGVFGSGILRADKFDLIIKNRGLDLGIVTDIVDTEIHTDIKGILKSMTSPAGNASSSGNDTIVITEETNLSELRPIIKSLGYDLSGDDYGKVHTAVKKLCQDRSSIGAKELEAIIATYAMQAPSTYHIENYLTTTGSGTASVSQITLSSNGEVFTGVSSGDGPIDSLFKAIEQAIGHSYELEDFQIAAVTEGKEALGSALVKIRSGNKLYSGNGISADILAAGIRAYINALNKVINDEG
ncbi:MAG: hypothetical protein K6B52_02110 [Clostridiales bacterium]|nr:hypothetical protein [Clostridiales bacterium]